MNTCSYCGNQIEEKTKSGKVRKYCNKSCSRKHYCENNKDKVIETNKRAYQTLLKENPDAIKNRSNLASMWWETEEGKEYAKKLKDSGHFKMMSDIGNATRKLKGNSQEQIKKWKETYEKNGYMVGNPTEWNQYNRRCRYLTRKKYGSAGDDFVWDHIVPISYGFKNKISPELICSSLNVRKIKSSENRKKWMSLTEESKKILKSWGMA